MLGRRGVLAGALGIAALPAALTACDVDDLRPPEDDAEPTPSGPPSATPEPDADLTLAEDVGLEMAVALALVEDVRRRFPRLRRRLQPLVRMHRAHLEVLEAPDRSSVPAPPPTASPAEALAAVRAVEDALHLRLAGAAVEARSGALARLLASVSASVSQHVLTTLPPAPPTDGGPP